MQAGGLGFKSRRVHLLLRTNPKEKNHRFISSRIQGHITIPLIDVPSGDYILRIQASDGRDTSIVISRQVRIDHITDTLAIDAYEPLHVRELLVREGQRFSVVAKDLFSRPISYSWSIDGVAVGDDTPLYNMVADTPGNITILAEVTNGLHTVHHTWTVMVREPVSPRLVVVRPEGDVTGLKRETFEVVVENPDERPYEIVWMVGQETTGDGSTLQRSLAFESGGDRVVKAMLVSMDGTDSVSWKVSIVNRGPEIGSHTPEEGTITIRTDKTLGFGVSAIDPDEDDLTYAWGSSRLQLDDVVGSECVVDLPCDDEVPYTIHVTVSDGDAEVGFEWTVEPRPPAPPVNHAPVLESRTPEDGTIVIDRDTAFDFSVLATDPDGDDLTYAWVSSKIPLDLRNDPAYHVPCPFSEDGWYTIQVTVSDGEESIVVEWTVESKAKQEPLTLHNGSLPWVLMAAIVAIAAIAAVGYAYWVKSSSIEE